MKKIIFLCTGNSCRSQMAEGFMRNMAGDRFQVVSAGVEPTQVNPYAIKVMAEVDIDISTHQSKSVNVFLNWQFDYVITVCNHARQLCPVFPGQHQHIHWDIEDPADFRGSKQDKIKFFRKIRDEIKKKCLEFLKNF
jgi:arsenate reductase (thioredoxin)